MKTCAANWRCGSALKGSKPLPDSCGRSIRIIMRWSTAATLRASSGHWKSACKPGSPTRERGFGIVKVGIDMPREELYGRIDRRVGQMLADGLEAEARAMYPYRGLNALQTVGYREFFDYFDGRISYDQAVELIKRNSRRYAKRQLTWFRRDAEIRWFGPDQTGAIINYIDFGES